MDVSTQIEQICKVMTRLDVDVRFENLGGMGGGMCRIKGRRLMILDLDSDELSRLDVAVAAMAELPELEGLYLPPAIREQIRRHQEQGEE